MIRSLFVSMQELNKGARRPADVPASKLKKVGVVGAGFMGAGIAYVTAQWPGIEVVLVDRDHRGGREGQGLFAQAGHRPDHQGPGQDRRFAMRCSAASRRLGRLCRSQGLRPRSSRRCSRIPKVKAEVIAKVEAVRSAPRPSSAPTPRRCRSRAWPRRAQRAPEEFHRHPFLLAGREDAAGRDHHGQEDRQEGARHGARLSSAPSRRRRSSSTIRQRLLCQSLRRQLSSARATSC